MKTSWTIQSIHLSKIVNNTQPSATHAAAENEPDDAHGELISCVTAVDAVYSLSA